MSSFRRAMALSLSLIGSFSFMIHQECDAAPLSDSYSDPSVQIPVRRTARLALLDGQRKILLMNINSIDVYDPKAPMKKPFWVTIGGKIEEGETLHEAAIREGIEETGQTGIRIFEPIWKGSVRLNWKGVPTDLQETFLLATTDSHEVHTEGLTDEEKLVVQKYKWWTVDEIRKSDETIIPQNLADLLEALPADLNEMNHGEVLEIDLSTPEEKVGSSS